MVATLQEIGLDAKAPSATLYIWTKVPDGHTSASFTEKLLEEVNVVDPSQVIDTDEDESQIKLEL